MIGLFLYASWTFVGKLIPSPIYKYAYQICVIS